jgi:hypothetical protein
MPRQYTSTPPIQRFWSKVNKTDGCWLWTAGKFATGYGSFSLNHHKTIKAHRFSYALAYGPIPDSLFVCHRCDVRACVRPDHLFLGTPADNMHDRDRKGRAMKGDRHWSRLHPERRATGERHGNSTHPETRPRGQGHWKARFTDDEVRAIKAEHAAGGITCRALAKRLHVSSSTIERIVNGRFWRHV